MINSLKYAAAAAAAVFAPVSASALTYSGSLSDGDTFAFSDGVGTLGGISFFGEGAGTITLNILNDVGTNMRLAFTTLSNALSGVTYSLDGAAVAPDFSAPITGLSQLVISYTGATPGDDISLALSAVPVPAAAALMLTALGGLALARRRKQA